MSLSDKAIQEFKDLMKKEYGEELTDEEARERGERLVSFFMILIDIDQGDKNKNKLKT